jgi:cytochrome c biogenesis protein
MSLSLPAARKADKTFPEIVWDWLACFRSVQLAIVLLSLLAIGIVIGVMIPQDGLVETAEIKKQFGQNYHLLKALGLFNVFSSYWFLTLEVLFFFSLLFGSFQWLRPAYRAATQRYMCNPENILASPRHFTLSSPSTPKVARKAAEAVLKKRGYRVHLDADTHRLYATRNNFSRFGPCVAHTGILLLLIFSLYGAFTGFKAQKIAVPGESFNISQSNNFVPNVNMSIWQGSIPDWQIRVKDFRMEFYPEKPETVKQYYCDVEIVNPDGKVQTAKTISVNYPLTIGDVSIYQASFMPTGKLFLEINGKPVTVNADTQLQNRPMGVVPLDDNRSLFVFPFFRSQDPGEVQNRLVMFVREGNGFLGAAPGKMPENLRISEGEGGTLGDLNIRYLKPEFATGLQIKKAPETTGIYLAFLIIMVGTVMCIFSQRQIWLAFDPKAEQGSRALFMYRTNRGPIGFQRELEKIQKDLVREFRLRSANAV